MSELLASLHPVVVCLIVCAAKILEITIQSLKTCMMVKGQRVKAACLGFVEHSMGYTVFQGQGSTDTMHMIFIVLARKDAGKVLRELRRVCDNKLFVAVSEVSKYAGGYGMVK